MRNGVYLYYIALAIPFIVFSCPCVCSVPSLNALPVLKAQHEENVRMVEEIFKKNEDVRIELKEEEEAVLKRKAKVSEEELARRQALMRAQRELIVAKKKQERSDNREQ